MTVPRIPPQAPPCFTHTPKTLLEETKELIEKSRILEDELAKQYTPETATFDNVMKVMAQDEDEMALKTHILGFYQYVSKAKELRDASSAAEKDLDVSHSTPSPSHQLFFPRG